MKPVLVGKFTHGKPPFGVIKEFFVCLKLRGDCYEMRLFKWDSEFSPFKESPIAHVWIRIEELDVSQPLVDSIWVRFEDEISKEVLEGFWVRVYYDAVPPFCTLCSHISHGLESCKRRPGKMNERDPHKVFETLSQPGDFTVGKVFDVLPQSDNNSNVVSMSAGTHGTRFGRKGVVSKVWKVKQQGTCVEYSKGASNSDMVQEVSYNSAQTGGLVVEPAGVARLDDKDDRARATMDIFYGRCRHHRCFKLFLVQQFMGRDHITSMVQGVWMSSNDKVETAGCSLVDIEVGPNLEVAQLFHDINKQSELPVSITIPADLE
ncbi:hypothetical protein LIER_28180 [Lithospermum erythrorhizon]|uniref:DUF4283 domain-containing protein n=1 Tax=Lithospermum erythrorhizon TaxID=34254 RepID=A0AAV3RIB0_LITER